MSSKKVWFITGSSSGFGLSIAEYALNRGNKVVATLRKPEVLSDLATKHPERLLVLRLDVTKPTEVTAAFAASKEKFGRIDVVVNNAGYAMTAEVEGTPEAAARGLFEANFWGASHVSREAVRFFREENQPMGGRLLQISSMVGIKPMSASVYYSATKFALEGLSEGLAEEVHPDWSVKVTLIEPGPFRTKGATTMVSEPVHPAYTDPSLPTMKFRAASASAGQLFDGDVDKFAEVVYKVAYLEDPPLRLPVHPLAVVTLREKGKHLVETANKWESWSDDVLVKD